MKTETFSYEKGYMYLTVGALVLLLHLIRMPEESLGVE